jgi:L-fuconolactonase
MSIDAHHHLWTLARGDYGWLAPIYRDFGLSDLAPHLAAAGIEGTILVQAAPTEAETMFLLDIAEHACAGSGRLDGFRCSRRRRALRGARRAKLLVGLRPMVQHIADDDWLLSPALAPLPAAMARNGLVFDALVLPRNLPQCDIALLAEHPNIVCKLSGLLTEAAPDWQIADLRRRWIMLLRASGRSACCGEATGRWSIWRGLMQNGSPPPKPC